MARGRKSSLRIVLSSEEQATLERWQRSTTIAAGLVRRGKIILLLAAGHSHSDGGRSVGVQRTGGPHVGQTLSGAAPGRAFRRPWPWCHG
jgi:hypothetical protein